jgi:hypothetical protein
MIAENNLLSFKAKWLTVYHLGASGPYGLEPNANLPTYPPTYLSVYHLHECADDLRFAHKMY